MKPFDITVVGLGYAGLSLAFAAVEAGLQVAGVDIDEGKIAALNSGHGYTGDVSDGDVQQMLTASTLFTTDVNNVDSSDAYVISVPTPLDASGRPDLSFVEDASKAIASVLKRGDLVILESTSYPGTLDGLVRPILDTAGLEPGQDYYLAFSPERMDPGNKRLGVRDTPRLVGGLTSRCTDAAVVLMSRFCSSVVRVDGAREAELAKLIENIYRQVNIALVNEILILGRQLGVDVWTALRAAATKPEGYQSFMPGPGVGGHCIPVDPLYLSAAASRVGASATLITAADLINRRMPQYVVSRALEILGGELEHTVGATVLLLGVSYKADVADDRGTPAREIAAGLRSNGISVKYHDPYHESWDLLGAGLVAREAQLAAAILDANLVVLLQAHSNYVDGGVLEEAQVVLDTRGVIHLPNVVRL
jgi:UDP-N-acetyl-D-glucosamine dehydrogenase